MFETTNNDKQKQIIELKKQFVEIAEKLAKLGPISPNTFLVTDDPKSRVPAEEVKVTIVGGHYEITARINPNYTEEQQQPQKHPYQTFADVFGRPPLSAQLNPNPYYGGVMNYEFAADNNPTMYLPEVISVLYKTCVKIAKALCIDNRKDAGVNNIYILKDVYQLIRSKLNTFLATTESASGAGTTYSYSLCMANIISVEQVVDAFMKEECSLETFGTPILPMCTIDNAISLGKDGSVCMYPRTAEDRQFMVPGHCVKLTEVVLYRFTDSDDRWLWVNPVELVKAIFELSARDIRLITAKHNTYVEFFERTFVSAVDEFNRTTEDESDRIKQLYMMDCLAQCPACEAFIAHYKHMYADEIKKIKDRVND